MADVVHKLTKEEFMNKLKDSRQLKIEAKRQAEKLMAREITEYYKNRKMKRKPKTIFWGGFRTSLCHAKMYLL